MCKGVKRCFHLNKMLNESNKNTCEYCNTILSTISSLNYHKKQIKNVYYYEI